MSLLRSELSRISAPAAIEVLECIMSPQRERFVHVCALGSDSHALLSHNLPSTRIVPVPVPPDVGTMVNDLEVLALLGPRALDLRSLIVAGRSSAALEGFCSERGITTVGMGTGKQARLEDKIFWHELMEEYRIPVPRGRALRPGGAVHDLSLPAVLQIPTSHSSRGTFVVRTGAELDERLAGLGGASCLCRALEPGLPLGVSIFIGGGRRLFSALRAQANHLSCPRDGLLGIQWITKDCLGRALADEVERVLVRLSDALLERGYHGLFNVDFLAGSRGVFVLECNPRLSAATPQIAAHAELIHGRELWSQYLAALADEPLGEDAAVIPESAFEGSFVDFESYYLANRPIGGEESVGEMPPLGAYGIVDGAVTYLGPRIDLKPGEEAGFFYHTAQRGARLGSGPDLGILATSFPLFTVSGDALLPIERGLALLDGLAERVRIGGR